MDQRADSPDARYARPKPRPYAPARPSLIRYLLAIAAVAAVSALAIWGGLSAQMSAGHDPALGDKTVTPAAAAAVAPAGTPIPSGSAEDGSDGIETDNSDGGGVIVVGASPPAQTPPLGVSPAPTPVQTATS